jgi:Cytosine specific DNA methyltransferase replication foci domain
MPPVGFAPGVADMWHPPTGALNEGQLAVLQPSLDAGVSPTGDLPYRVLHNYAFYDRATGRFVSLNAIGEKHLVGVGELVRMPQCERTGCAVWFDVVEWCIEYQRCPVLWVRSQNAWYKLLEEEKSLTPDPSYALLFEPIYRKYYLCAFLYSLLSNHACQPSARERESVFHTLRNSYYAAVSKWAPHPVYLSKV